MSRVPARLLFLALVALLAFPPLAHAQLTRGAISGTVGRPAGGGRPRRVRDRQEPGHGGEPGAITTSTASTACRRSIPAATWSGPSSPASRPSRTPRSRSAPRKRSRCPSTLA